MATTWSLASYLICQPTPLWDKHLLQISQRGTTWAWCTWHQKPLTHIFPSFCTTIPEKTLFIMVGKLHKPVILKSYFIVSSNMTGNDHKMINHYVTDLDVTGKRNIIRDCNITPVSKNYPCVLLHCVMLHGWVTLANDLILCLRFLLYWYTQVMSSIPAATGAIQLDEVMTLVAWWLLTHWGRVTHICVIKLTIIGSDNGLSPGRRQAIIWINAGILLIGPLGTNFSENLIGILTFSFTKMRLKVSSAKCRPFCLGLNVLTDH